MLAGFTYHMLSYESDGEPDMRCQHCPDDAALIVYNGQPACTSCVSVLYDRCGECFELIPSVKLLYSTRRETPICDGCYEAARREQSVPTAPKL